MFVLTCPCCYGRYPLETALNDDEARAAISAALRLHPLGRVIISYMGLFRPPTRATTMRRATRLLVELVEAIEAGQVNRHGRVWAAPRENWARALEEVLARRDQDKLRLPLKDHAYLYEIVAGQANRTEAVAEQRVEDARRHAPAPSSDARTPAAAPRSAAELASGLGQMWQALGRDRPGRAAADASPETDDD